MPTSISPDPVSLLRDSGVAGPILTPSRDVVHKARLLEAGDRSVTLGLDGLLPATASEVLDALESLGGWRPTDGDPGGSHANAGALVGHAAKASARLRDACERGERVFLGTGHPTGPLAMYIRLAGALEARGAEVVAGFREDVNFRLDGAPARHRVRYVGGVACMTEGSCLLHTHAPDAMAFLMDSGLRPDLVVGDHGFAGVALSRGVESIAMIDTNDPGLVLAWARGLPVTPLLCDDNRRPQDYDPLLDVLLSELG